MGKHLAPSADCDALGIDLRERARPSCVKRDYTPSRPAGCDTVRSSKRTMPPIKGRDDDWERAVDLPGVQSHRRNDVLSGLRRAFAKHERSDASRPLRRAVARSPRSMGASFAVSPPVTRPGALTVAYLRGQRKADLLPFQIFLVANVLFFAIQSVTGENVFSTTLDSHLHHQMGCLRATVGRASGREPAYDAGSICAGLR